MEKVDKLIESLCDHITDCIDKGSCSEEAIAENTKALAELVSARANVKTSTLKLTIGEREIN